MTNSFSLNATQPHSGLHLATPLRHLKQALLSVGWCMGLLAMGGHANHVLAQGPVKVRPADYIVAVVNSEPITNNEVQNLKLRLEKQVVPGSPVPDARAGRKTLQAVFCIDVRSEVFRRALEGLDPTVETIGFAGFFSKDAIIEAIDAQIPLLVVINLDEAEVAEAARVEKGTGLTTSTSGCRLTLTVGTKPSPTASVTMWPESESSASDPAARPTTTWRRRRPPRARRSTTAGAPGARRSTPSSTWAGASASST